MSSGADGKGFAICLVCGRAEAETEERPGFKSPLPGSMARHKPLAMTKGVNLANGYCPGGFTEPQRVLQNIRLVHAARSDVFELQLPMAKTMAQALALGAALREAFAETLGADAREIGVGADRSTGPSDAKYFSAFCSIAGPAEPDWRRVSAMSAFSASACRSQPNASTARSIASMVARPAFCGRI